MASSKSSLFQVYLRLRPPPPNNSQSERFLSVEETEDDSCPTHITINPPNDRRRNVEKFAFTRVFDEESSQLDVFHCTGVSSLVEGVLAPHGGDGTDALLATLGVTGSGKTHTILGSRTQRGMTQLALDVIFRSIGSNLVDYNTYPALETSLQASDASEATITTAGSLLDVMYDLSGSTRAPSRAATPMIGEHQPPPTPLRLRQRPSGLPQSPDVSNVNVSSDPSAEYAVIISMYELYLDRIYDLLTPAIKTAATKEYRRRPLLFKSTEMSPDRKVVAGLRKVVCNNLKDALTVLEAGLQERRIAGTGSNSVSSRSHGFFCIEVKKRRKSRNPAPWGGSTLTIVDLAGSERARDAKTQGATLAEAGKINESLMYLGQCLQMQSDASSSTKPNMVPFRQCKLTEVLFSNSFPSHSLNQVTAPTRNPQKAVMIVTVDPLGDFNATCQILRYSTLAREVTVPRIPSLSQTMLASQMGPQQPFTSPLISPAGQHRSFFATTHGSGGGSGSYRNFSGSHDGDRATMELAALEIARMTEEIEALRAEASREREARLAAEAHLLTTEDRMLDMEQAVREECVAEFEARLALELARCKASLAVEQERGEEHWDRKVEVIERGLGFGAGAESDDSDDKENVLVENLEEEIERLRRDNAVLRRELAGRSPTKRKPLQEREDFSEASGLGRKMERLRVSNESVASIGSAGPGSPKKVRRIGGKRWEDDEAVF